VTIAPTLVLPDWIADEISRAALERNETGAVLLAGIARAGDDLRILGRELVWVPEEAYDRRTPRSLSIRSTGYVGALGRAAQRGDVPIWLHTHPGHFADPTRSEYDEVVDDELRDTFRIRSGADVYATIVASPDDKLFRFTATVWDRNAAPKPIERLVVVGDRIALRSAHDAREDTKLPEQFDRQVRAFGGDVQRVLARLHVAIVGCGGTGSAVAEQLARLGVGQLLLIDHDVLSESNVTRVYGSSPDDVGRPKVDVLAQHLRRIAPGTDVTTTRGTINDQPMARALTSCDIAYGCTDDNAGRLVLSRLASYYFVPVIDVGVLLSSLDGELRGIDGRVTVLTPGAACLVCRNRIDLARAAAEQLSADEHAARVAEGYAPELAGVEPAVVAYTSAVASFAVAELLERLVGYGREPVPSELLLRCHDREISTNRVLPKARHYCHPDGGLLGSGDRHPFLGQTWGAP
jgi:molybdopterin/thiamine biosynthesis adenylyltransferase